MDADAATAASGSAVPVLLADSALSTAAAGNLYYAIVDIDVAQNADDFILNSLGIDQDADLQDGNLVRAVSTRSGVSTTDLLVQRNDQVFRAGMLWQEFEIPKTPSSGTIDSSLFQDPFAFQIGARALIYTQPNGLFVFAVVDENGAFVEQDENLLDVRRANPRTLNPISCSSCHASGLFPVNDEAGPLLLANARAVGLNRDEVEQLQQLYVHSNEFAALASEDSTGFYLRALQLLGLPLSGPDPVAGVYDRFGADVVLADVAGDLGVTPADLRPNLDLLHPALAGLQIGSLDRATHTQAYVDSLCIMSVILENQPDPAVCDAAAAALDSFDIPIAVAR